MCIKSDCNGLTCGSCCCIPFSIRRAADILTSTTHHDERPGDLQPASIMLSQPTGQLWIYLYRAEYLIENLHVWQPGQSLGILFKQSMKHHVHVPQSIALWCPIHSVLHFPSLRTHIKTLQLMSACGGCFTHDEGQPEFFKGDGKTCYMVRK